MNEKSITTNSAKQLDGPGGLQMTGGDLTPPQNAGETLDALNEQRHAEPRMEQRQQSGAVAQQTLAQKPSATNPEGVPDPIPGQPVE
jgi:hypothetical protein